MTLHLSDIDIFASAGVRVLFHLRERRATHSHALDIIAVDHTPAQQVLDLVGLTRRSRPE